MSDPKLAETVASRGNNLVLIAPPAPSLARPLLAGLLARHRSEPGARSLALTPPEAVDEWARVAAEVAGSSGQRVAGVQTAARLARLLHTEDIAVLFASPETAHELVRRSALKLDSLAAILLLWPEAYGEALIDSLLQDVPKETQRLVVTADPLGSASLIERYCWRAPVSDLLGPEPLSPPPTVRSVPTSWSRRAHTLLDLVEQLDPASLAVSVSDLSERGEIERALATAGVNATIGSDTLSAELIVAYDLPAPGKLRELAAAGDVVLLIPPGTEGYVARLAPQRRPLHSLGALQVAQAGVARDRRSIVETIEAGSRTGAYAALAPLFERHEATAIAAALYDLWEQARTARSQPATTARPPQASVQLWVGIGKRDAVTPHDLVATLLRDCEVPKDSIGKIEIRESFALVQLGAAVDAEQIADKLTGKTIRKRRLVARVDKGRPARR
ncbi:MAG TPA: DbpA RNA binding domain-containing protein [Gemmatimonadales bacterium]|nr:DbpA RNA binding domain-containing protein [Gemmatimonadales bacterium]